MDFGGIGDLGTSLVGSSEESATSGTKSGVSSGVTTSQLQLQQDAIDKIVADVLGSETGLAQVFSSENVAGLFDSSVAAQASGDLVANLVGELAKLTGKTVKTKDELLLEETDTTTQSGSGGILGQLGINPSLTGGGLKENLGNLGSDSLLGF